MAETVENFSSQLSEKIWGHRFRDGQRGPEYVLEFLNVMRGTKYKLDQPEYIRRKMINFRKFVFEGDKEGRKNETVYLGDDKKEYLYENFDERNHVDIIREYLNNLQVPLFDGRGKEANRSWYAKSLYPLHEDLLFFEVRKKGDNISYERNFYARGGELYYLMLSYGSQDDLSIRKKIEDRLQDLLKKNKTIENVVKKIIYPLGDEGIEDTTFPLKKNGEKNFDEYPTLPEANHPLYKTFAKEFASVISLKLDIYQMFIILTSLMTFHIMQYMIYQAKEKKEDSVFYFFDCLDGQISQVLSLSSQVFKKNELLIKNKFENYFQEIFKGKISGEEFVKENLPKWKSDPDSFIEFMGLTKLHKRKRKVIEELKKCEGYPDVENKLFNVIKDVISDQLKKTQLNLIRGLVRDGGMGGFRPGTKYRYYITDNFLKVLVFANVPPTEELEFSSFLNELYKKYGIVIGENEAKQSNLYQNSGLNIDYFQKNEKSLRLKLKQNGLLKEFSDATAMIINPYQKGY